MPNTDQHAALNQMDKGAKQDNFLKGMPFRKSGEQWTEKYFRCFRP